MLTRRALLGGATALAAYAALSPARAATTVRVGAIRWDAWYDNSPGTPGNYTQTDLSPAQYQFRAPWFATQINADRLTINGNQQATMDAEISYAVSAGLKYWAYDQYSLTSGMSNAWKLHQSSASANNINWCWLTSFQGFVGFMSDGGASYVSNFKAANYEMVATNRPLFFLTTDSTAYATVASNITTLSSACAAAGVGSPYFVVQYGNATTAPSIVTAIGADAISNYAYIVAGIALPYSTLVSGAEAFWTTQAATGVPVVPLATAGWDRRPRIDRPVYWETQLPWIGDLDYVQTATAAAIAAHVSDMLTWMGTNAAAVPSNHALIYAWNEHDEGGWLNPTWTTSGPDTSRITALGGIL